MISKFKKISILSFFLLSSYIISSSKFYDYNWVYFTNNSGETILTSIITDKNGDSYSIGTINIFNQSDWLIIKTDKEGNTIWNKQYDGEYGDDQPNALKIDDTGLYVVGYESKLNQSWGIKKDLLIKKYDLISGNEIWSYNYDSSITSEGIDDIGEYIYLNSSYIYVSGTSYSDDLVVEDTSFGTDIISLKLDTMNGELQWINRYVPERDLNFNSRVNPIWYAFPNPEEFVSYVYPKDITLTYEEFFVVTGYHSINQETKGLILIYDDGGDLVKEIYYSPSDNSKKNFRFEKMKNFGKDNVLISSNFYNFDGSNSNITFISMNYYSGNFDFEKTDSITNIISPSFVDLELDSLLNYYVLFNTDLMNLKKFSKAGDFLWERNFTKTSGKFFESKSIELTSSNNIYISGSTAGRKQKDSSSNENIDLFLLKYNLEGNLISSNYFLTSPNAVYLKNYGLGMNIYVNEREELDSIYLSGYSTNFPNEENNYTTEILGTILNMTVPW